jgi:hypothetical protein
VAGPLGSGDAQLTLVQIHVRPFEPDHFAASQARFVAQQHDQVRLRFSIRGVDKTLELIEPVEAGFAFREITVANGID